MIHYNTGVEIGFEMKKLFWTDASFTTATATIHRQALWLINSIQLPGIAWDDSNEVLKSQNMGAYLYLGSIKNASKILYWSRFLKYFDLVRLGLNQYNFFHREYGHLVIIYMFPNLRGNL